MLQNGARKPCDEAFWIALDLTLWGQVQTTAKLPPSPQHRRNILADPPRVGPAAHAAKTTQNYGFLMIFLNVSKTRVHFHDVQILTRYPNIETPETPRIFHTFSCFLFISVDRPKHFSHETQSRQPAVDAPPASVMAPPRL